MRLVSFYADVDGNTYYSSAARKLVERCVALGIEHSIREQRFGDTWIDNVRAKPTFLLKTLEELRAPFVWLDCDCLIHKPLDFQMNNWGVLLRADGTPHDFVHYVPNTADARGFLRLWINAVETQKRGSHSAFVSIFNELKTEALPPGYFELGLAETPSKSTLFPTLS